MLKSMKTQYKTPTLQHVDPMGVEVDEVVVVTGSMVDVVEPEDLGTLFQGVARLPTGAASTMQMQTKDVASADLQGRLMLLSSPTQ